MSIINTNVALSISHTKLHWSTQTEFSLRADSHCMCRRPKAKSSDTGSVSSLQQWVRNNVASQWLKHTPWTAVRIYGWWVHTLTYPMCGSKAACTLHKEQSMKLVFRNYVLKCVALGGLPCKNIFSAIKYFKYQIGQTQICPYWHE